MDNHQTPDNWIYLEEMRLRGLYLTITVDFDFNLMSLIRECFSSNLNEIKTFYKDKHGNGKDLSELTMFQKLNVCKKGLKKYHPNAFKEHEQTFTNIDQMRQFRNKFAHQKIDDFLSPNDKTKLTLHELKDNLKIEKTEYKIADLYKMLYDYRAVMRDTLILVAKVLNYPAPIF